VTMLYALGDEAADARGSLILHDLKVATGRALAIDGRAPFTWLEPGFSSDIYVSVQQRLDAGLSSLPAGERRLTATGIRTALSTAVSQWMGAQVTLTLLDWVRVSVPELLTPKVLLALIFLYNPNDKNESAYWIREISRRYESWHIELAQLVDSSNEVSEAEWSAVALRSDDSDRIDVACWLLTGLRKNAKLLQFVRRAAFADLREKLPVLPSGVSDWWDDVEVPVARASGVSDPISAADVDEKLTTRAFLQSWASDADEDWSARQEHEPEREAA